MLRNLLTLVTALTLLLLATPDARAKPAAPVPRYAFVGPVFGLALAPNGSLLVADSGAGIVELNEDGGSLIAELPGISDVDSIGRGKMFAITGGGEGQAATRLFSASRGKVKQIANLGAFEATVNPDGMEINPNPIDVETLPGGQALVADAGGNALLIADQHGAVDWVATLPPEDVSTENAQRLLGCPDVPEELAFLCFVDSFPAQAVATSVAIGPDGAYYVGELKGFPAPTGASRVWRIEPGTRHAECGVSPACRVVADGFTSIIDIQFGPDGRFYVVELDESSWLAPEVGQASGGTINACKPAIEGWTCKTVASDLLPNPTAVAIGDDGTIYAALLDFSTFQSQVAVVQ
jgi:hypothetical protein